jgi:hypothetical protein
MALEVLMDKQPGKNTLGGIIAVLLVILAVKFVIGFILGALKTILTLAFLAGLVAVVYWFYQQRKPPEGSNSTL